MLKTLKHAIMTILKFPLLALFLGAALSVRAAENIPKIDNDQTRVLVVTSAKDAKSALHDHKVNRVMIYLDAGQMTLTDTNGNVESLRFKANEALWSRATGPHISRNTSGHPVRIVEIEIKPKPAAAPAAPAPKPSPLDPLKSDPKRYKFEWENDQVRVFRARYAPHEKGTLHEHVLDRVVTFITDANMKVTTPDGESKILQASAGDVIFGGQAKHTEENMSDKPFEVVVVEFKP